MVRKKSQAVQALLGPADGEEWSNGLLEWWITGKTLPGPIAPSVDGLPPSSDSGATSWRGEPIFHYSTTSIRHRVSMFFGRFWVLRNRFQRIRQAAWVGY